MPRVTPKRRPTEMDSIAAAQMAEARKRADRRGKPAYAADSPHSFFSDLLLDAQARARRDKALDSPRLRGRDPGADMPATHRGDTLQSVRARLADAAAEAEIRQLRSGVERRDLDSTTLYGGAEFVASQLPDHLAREFAAGAATQASFSLALRRIRLPEKGITFPIPVLEDGPETTGVMDNQTVSEQDPARIRIFPEVGSDTLTVRIQALQVAAA